MENVKQKTNDELGLYPVNGEVTFLMPNTNAIGRLKEAKEGMTLTSKYMTLEDWIAEQGVEKRCFYLGMKEALDSDGEKYYLAKLHDGEKPFVVAQTILVQSLWNTPIGQGVAITCTGAEKNNNGGKTATFEVTQLELNLNDKPNG